jgi:hypothetical protein
MVALEPSELWDRWKAERQEHPELDAEAFVRSFGADAGAAFETLQAMLVLEREVAPPPLVDVSKPGPGFDGTPLTFAGFRIESEIGHGTSGMVFLAINEREGSMHERVALKVLNPLLSASPERRDSILREAEIAGALDHDGIVKLVSSGVERSYAWIATEWVDGTSLEALIDRRDDARTRERRALEIGLQLARALAYAHAKGIVHRDLKPANLLLSRDGKLKILDFGLARTDGTAFTMSRTGEAVGTPLYMAPEQARGERDIGPWTDIYAVGLILHEMGSGERLSADRNLVSTLARIASGRYRMPRSKLRLLPKGLRGIVSRCLEPHPHDRYATCAELARDIENAFDGRSLATGALASHTRWLRAARRRPGLTAAAVAGLGLLAWVGWYAWWTWPMTVTFDEQLGGKVLWVDGKELGGTPQIFTARPGRHEFSARFVNAPVVYHGAFDVKNREPAFIFKFLEPAHGVPEGPKFGEYPEGGWAWTQVSTPLGKMRLTIDGRAYDDMPGITSFRLPLGTHTIRVEHDGDRPFERAVHLRDQSLCMVDAEMDPAQSPWHTIIVYSPVESIVREGMISEDNVRLYCEDDPISNFDLRFVNRSYWGPSKSRHDGRVLFAIELPLAASDIEVESVKHCVAVEEGWYRIEMGPNAESLTTVLDETLPPSPEYDAMPAHADPVTGAEFARLESAQFSKFRDTMRGSSRLFVRLSVGGVPEGSSCVYAYALRAQAMPVMRPEGVLMWCPAMRIRVR